ncbi:MAG: hypothetical protein HY001_01415 [Candidatus Portnoybacteria bacterium]|nr:hypothetical protein [Candidatus Portnoybacteria bacterium]
MNKTYFGIKPFTPGLLLDGRAPSVQTADTATWNNVSAETHTITTTLAPNTKAFYAICANADDCVKSPEEGAAVPFTKTGNQNYAIRFIYTKDTIQIRDERVAAYMRDGDYTYDFTIGGMGHIPARCSMDVFTNANDEQYKLVDAAAKAWSGLGVAIHVIRDNNKGSEAPSSYTDTRGKGDGIHALRFGDFDLTDPRNPPGSQSALGLTSRWNEVGEEIISEVGFTTIKEPDAPITIVLSGDADISIDTVHPFYSTDPLNYALQIENVIGHEFGHMLGEPHFLNIIDADSIMGKAFISFPTPFDRDRLGDLYPKCAPSDKVFLDLSPSPAPFVGGICKGYSDPSRWQIGATITEVGGSVGATLNAFDIQYFEKSGNTLGKVTDKLFGALQGGKGFSTNHVNAGQSIGATLCQVPWNPEQLGSLEMTVKGTDDTGKAVQASDTITFQ